MKSTTKYSFILLLVLAMVLSACGRNEEPTAEPVAAPTDTPVPPTAVPPTDTPVPPTDTPVPPTDTPEPEPTDTPEPEPTDTPEPEPADTEASEEASEEEVSVMEAGPPFTGTFEGTISADEGTSSTISLELTQDGNDVSGTAIIGDGLLVNVGAGLCPGLAPVPPGAVGVSGTIPAGDPLHLNSSSQIEVSGFQLVVKVAADVSEDNNDMAVNIVIETPPFCLNPEMPAELERVGGPEPEPTPKPKPTATPEPEPEAEMGPPFTGIFEGTISADEGTSSTISLELTQDGNDVSGTAIIGDGLLVNVGAGLCPGLAPVPPGAVGVSGTIPAGDPLHLDSSSQIEVSGFQLVVKVAADVSEDNNDMAVNIVIETPPFCLNPEMPAELERVE